MELHDPEHDRLVGGGIQFFPQLVDGSVVLPHQSVNVTHNKRVQWHRGEIGLWFSVSVIRGSFDLPRNLL